MVERWQKKLRKIDKKIEVGDYKGANKAVDKLIMQEMVSSLLRGGGGSKLLALATVYQAVSDAGLGDEELAIWHWHTAQNLDPELRQISLAKFGPPGHILEYNRLRQAGEAPREMTVFDLNNQTVTPTHPQPLEVPYPIIPQELMAAWYAETADVEIVIDSEGHVREPVVLVGTLPGKVYLGLEAMRSWNYQPATLEGEPVAVYFHLEDFYDAIELRLGN